MSLPQQFSSGSRLNDLAAAGATHFSLYTGNDESIEQPSLYTIMPAVHGTTTSRPPNVSARSPKPAEIGASDEGSHFDSS